MPSIPLIGQGDPPRLKVDSPAQVNVLPVGVGFHEGAAGSAVKPLRSMPARSDWPGTFQCFGTQVVATRERIRGPDWTIPTFLLNGHLAAAKMSEALLPQKPDELDMTARTSLRRGSE
jgi:hypothetical protein